MNKLCNMNILSIVSLTFNCNDIKDVSAVLL
jgi:hypothetical protein